MPETKKKERSKQTGKTGNAFTRLEAEIKERQVRLEDMRRRDDQKKAADQLKKTTELTIQQEKPQIKMEIDRAETLIARIKADRKAHKKDYERAVKKVLGVKKKADASRNEVEKAQAAFDKATAEYANAKQRVEALPAEVRVQRNIVTELSQRIDTGLKVRRFDLGFASKNLEDAITNLNTLRSGTELNSRQRRLNSATKRLREATAKLQVAKTTFDAHATQLSDAENTTHEARA